MRLAPQKPIPQELIDKALEWSVLDYFNHFEPNVIHQVGSGYRRKDHPSCCISGDGWLFDWKSRGLSGKGALSYLKQCEGIAFRDAVALLTGEDISVAREQNDEQVIHKLSIPFALPERNYTNQNVIDYLSSRGISKEVINYCISKGLVYQSKEYSGATLIGYDEYDNPLYIAKDTLKKLQEKDDITNLKSYCEKNNLLLSPIALSNMKRISNAVFVGYDNNNKPAYATKRGMYNKTVIVDGKEKNKSFRQEVTGSSKRHSFFMRDLSDKSKSIHIFEAAIDAMSYATLIDLYSSNYKTKNLLSLCGATSGRDSKFNSDDTVLPPALQNVLDDKSLNIDTVYIHFDNDKTGQEQSIKLKNKLEKLGIKSQIKLPPSGKDFNDFLKNTIAKLEQDTTKNARDVLLQR